jgi:hypothetical protein
LGTQEKVIHGTKIRRKMKDTDLGECLDTGIIECINTDLCSTKYNNIYLVKECH